MGVILVLAIITWSDVEEQVITWSDAVDQVLLGFAMSMLLLLIIIALALYEDYVHGLIPPPPWKLGMPAG